MNLLFLLLLAGAPVILFILHLIALAVLKKKKKINIMLLSIYGWAFVIVLMILFFVLWPMGTGPSRPPSSGCTGFEHVTPIDCKADNSGMIELVLTNEVGAKVELKNVSADVFGISCTIPYNPATKPQLRAGQSINLNVTGCTFNGVGEYYKADITILYKNIVSGMDHNSVGGCYGIVE